MVANAGLDNEKSALNYQVELLKDQMEEVEEQASLVTKELREKSRDYELLKRSHAETQRAVQLLQAQLDEQARLLAERGMVLVGNEDEETSCADQDRANANGGLLYEEQEKRTRAIVSSETASILGALGLKGQPLDVRIRKLAEERDDLGDTVRRLKMDLEEERARNSRLEKNGATFLITRRNGMGDQKKRLMTTSSNFKKQSKILTPYKQTLLVWSLE